MWDDIQPYFIYTLDIYLLLKAWAQRPSCPTKAAAFLSCFSSFLCPPSDAEAQLRRLACVSTVLKFAEFSNCNTGFPSLFRFNFCQSFSFHFLAVVCFCLHSFEISNPILAIDFSGLSDSFSWVTLHPPAFLSHHRFILIREKTWKAELSHFFRLVTSKLYPPSSH